MAARDQATDCSGLPLAPGLLVRLVDGAEHTEGRIVRVIGDYDVVTVLVEDRAGKMERMVPCAEVEILIPARDPAAPPRRDVSPSPRRIATAASSRAA